MTNKKIKMLIASGTVLVALSSFAGPAFAQNNNQTSRPGWGFGDQNHIHTGPPGLTQRPEFDGDIPKFRTEIRAWAQSLREWIRSNWGRS